MFHPNSRKCGWRDPAFLPYLRVMTIHLLKTAAVGLLFLATIQVPAFAQAISPWVEEGAARLRLVAGEPARDGSLLAGLDEIGGADSTLLENGCDGTLDCLPGLQHGWIVVSLTQPIQHHRGGQNRCQRICDVPARELGSTSVRGLKQRVAVADFRGWREP